MFSTARTLSLTNLGHGYDIRVRDDCADTVLWINFNPFTRTKLGEASQRQCIDHAWIRARTAKAISMLKPAQ